VPLDADRPAAVRAGGRPTMRHVAEAAGVGVATVSRVINNSPGVSALTRDAVQGSIDALGFRPNFGARTLRRQRTSTIGLVLGDILEPHQTALVASIGAAAVAEGVQVVITSTDEDEARERHAVEELLARRVDGLVLVPAGRDHQYLAAEMAHGTKVVFVDRPAVGLEVDAVLTDNRGGARIAVTQLTAHGHRRIAGFFDRTGLFTAEERVAGYADGLTDAGIAYEAGLVHRGNPADARRIGAALRRLVTRRPAVTAIFSGNGSQTVTILNALQEMDYRPAFMAFDDVPLANVLTPAISVVSQDAAGTGRVAAELLFRRLGGDTGPVEQVRLATLLIARGSAERSPEPRPRQPDRAESAPAESAGPESPRGRREVSPPGGRRP